MKIGILTFHFSENYGALLQAFSLQEFLRNEGHTVEFINYHPYHVEQGASFRDILSPKLSKKYAKQLYLFTNHRFRKAISWMADNPFELFQEEVLSVSSIVYRDASDLNNFLSRSDYDHVIIGSDQVWNPSEQYGVDPVYFGDKFSNSVPTSSYAASFGSIQRVDKFVDEIKSYCSNLSNVSVREGEAQTFLASHGIKSVISPDPTLLLNKITDFAKEPFHHDLSNSLLVYALRDPYGIRELATSIATSQSLNLVSAYSPWRRWKAIGNELRLGPFEFLGAINASRFIISNSFHGVVLSVLQNKPFIAVSLPGKKQCLSVRIEAFLVSVGLENRLLSPNQLDAAIQLYHESIDWTEVQGKIEHLRGAGRSYLRSILSLH